MIEDRNIKIKVDCVIKKENARMVYQAGTIFWL